MRMSFCMSVTSSLIAANAGHFNHSACLATQRNCCTSARRALRCPCSGSGSHRVGTDRSDWSPTLAAPRIRAGAFGVRIASKELSNQNGLGTIMRHHIMRKEQVRSLCAELGEDDGRDLHPRPRPAATQWKRPSGRTANATNRTQVLATLPAGRRDAGRGLAEYGDPTLAGSARGERRAVSRRLAVAGDCDARRRPAPGSAFAGPWPCCGTSSPSRHLRYEVAAAVTTGLSAPSLLYRLRPAAHESRGHDNTPDAAPDRHGDLVIVIVALGFVLVLRQQGEHDSGKPWRLYQSRSDVELEGLMNVELRRLDDRGSP